jgi:hypothetical protein
MRHSRSAALAVAAFTLLGIAACGDDDSKDGTTFVTPTASAGAPGPGASAGTPAGPGGSATPTGTPTEGTASQKPPKKGGKANQGPVGRGGGSADTLSAAGLGPYSIGIKQSELKSAALIRSVAAKQSCTTAKGLGEYDTPALAFSGGKLQRIAVTSADVSTSTGAKVGSSLADVKAKYPAGKQLDDWVGASAWYAVDGGNALLFRIKDGKVAAIEAGPGQALQFHYTDKQGC